MKSHGQKNGVNGHLTDKQLLFDDEPEDNRNENGTRQDNGLFSSQREDPVKVLMDPYNKSDSDLSDANDDDLFKIEPANEVKEHGLGGLSPMANLDEDKQDEQLIDDKKYLSAPSEERHTDNDQEFQNIRNIELEVAAKDDDLAAGKAAPAALSDDGRGSEPLEDSKEDLERKDSLDHVKSQNSDMR